VGGGKSANGKWRQCGKLCLSKSHGPLQQLAKANFSQWVEKIEMAV